MRENVIRRGQGPIQNIGNAHGRIAIWCDLSEALAIAAQFPYPDRFGREIEDAIERAYPVIDESRFHGDA